jgi:hypothetical protein
MAGEEINKRVQEVMNDTGMEYFQAVSHLHQRDVILKRLKEEQNVTRNKLSESMFRGKQVTHTGHSGPIARNK